MIVLEFLCKGDLEEFLLSQIPEYVQALHMHSCMCMQRCNIRFVYESPLFIIQFARTQWFVFSCFYSKYT